MGAFLKIEEEQSACHLKLLIEKNCSKIHYLAAGNGFRPIYPGLPLYTKGTIEFCGDLMKMMEDAITLDNVLVKALRFKSSEVIIEIGRKKDKENRGMIYFNNLGNEVVIVTDKWININPN